MTTTRALDVRERLGAQRVALGIHTVPPSWAPLDSTLPQDFEPRDAPRALSAWIEVVESLGKMAQAPPIHATEQVRCSERAMRPSLRISA